MSINFQTGDMFASKAQALVNTVNCVGVMGKGVALEFKRRWPENYKAYKRACDLKALRPGSMLVFDRGQLFRDEPPRYIVNFPTKDHWRSKSKMTYISKGLDSLIEEIHRLGITSIAMPPLGCGNGGLDWKEVKPLIEAKLGGLSGVTIEVYGPAGESARPEFLGAPKRMTLARALYIKAIASVEPSLGGAVDRLSLQKIAYFLQELGVPLNLDFHDRLYGPHSYLLKKSTRVLERWGFVEGYEMGDRYVQVTPGGYAAADEFLQNAGVGDEVIDRLVSLIDGFGTPYGLELLARTHYYLNARGGRPASISMGSFQNERRQNTFSPHEIRSAKSRLRVEGLISE